MKNQCTQIHKLVKTNGVYSENGVTTMELLNEINPLLNVVLLSALFLTTIDMQLLFIFHFSLILHAGIGTINAAQPSSWSTRFLIISQLIVDESTKSLKLKNKFALN